MKLCYHQHGPLGTITLTNPPHNELMSPVFEDRKTLEEFLALPELKAAIVTGEGRNFCAGANEEKLQQLKTKDRADIQRVMTEGKALLRTLSDATIPVTAVIRGSCLGAGLEIALACHFRVASTNAMLGFPEVEHGLMPGLGGSVSIVKTARYSSAIELVLSGRMVRCEEAKSMGLVDACASTKDLQAKALAFIASLTERRDSDLVRTIMTSIRNADALSREEALKKETQLFCNLVEQQKDKQPK
jgi:enoyl-CoA hydratase/carnithine racemase